MRPPSSAIADNPHGSALARLIMNAWPAMLARFGEEARGGLSVRQIGRHLGPLGYNGRHSWGGKQDYGMIANTVAWLARRRHLEIVGGRACGEKGMTRYVAVGMPPAIESGMSGQIQRLDVVQQFLQPSVNSTTLTVVSKKSGTRFTYDIKRKEPNADGHADEVWYVDLLTGPDNRANFSALAVLTKREGRLTYIHSKKSTIGVDAPSAVAFKFAIEHVVTRPNPSVLAHVEFWHEGRCGRCGRKLTVPSSVELGLGPECAEKVGA